VSKSASEQGLMPNSLHSK